MAETVSRMAESGIRAQYMVHKLIEMGQWFEATPLPDGFWKIEVKSGNMTLLHRMWVEEMKRVEQ